MRCKLSYIQYIPHHRNFKGKFAPWVIRDEDTGKILSSHRTKQEAKKHLRNMKYFKRKVSSKSYDVSADNVYDLIITVFRQIISKYSTNSISYDFVKFMFRVLCIFYSIVLKLENTPSDFNEDESILGKLYIYLDNLYTIIHNTNDISLEKVLDVISKMKKDIFVEYDSLPLLFIEEGTKYSVHSDFIFTSTKVGVHIANIQNIINNLNTLINKSFTLEDVLQGSTDEKLIFTDKSNVQLREILLQLKHYFTQRKETELPSVVLQSINEFLLTTDMLLELFLSLDYYQEEFEILVSTWISLLNYLISLLDIPDIYDNLKKFYDYFIFLSNKKIVQKKVLIS